MTGDVSGISWRPPRTVTNVSGYLWSFDLYSTESDQRKKIKREKRVDWSVEMSGNCLLYRFAEAARS